MAKNKIYIDVVVDDKGTTERVAVSAKKLGIALNEAGKGGLTADRRLKGAAQASANGTKNFSKMAQGISGGLVPAYATLAAQVFAVSAAFQFLSSASNYKNLIESQEIYGAVTGTNFASITKSLQAATSGQLKYQEAASATAIGSAAGLTAGQLEGLAKAAQNSSVALGRDLTDSFNRLIRGTTKAEPELLDELGIILRLKPATEEYAASIGVAANDLNAFQRTQAVTNFVLEEADKKFGRLGEIMGDDAFVVSQFTKSFDDLVNVLKVGVINTLTPALKFLTENTNALVASLALFAIPITKSILPSLDDWAKSSKKAARAANIAFIRSKKVLQEQREEVEKLSDTQEKALKRANKLSKKALSPDTAGAKSGKGGIDFLSGKTDDKRAGASAKRILDSAEKNIDKSGKVTTGKLKGYNAAQVADLRKSYVIRTQIVDQQMKKQVKIHTRAFAQLKVGYRAVKVAGVGAFGAIQRAGVLAVKGIDKAFKAASFVGMAFLLFDLGKEAYNFLFGTEEAANKLNEELDRTNDRLSETAEFLSKINQTRAEGLLDLTQQATQTGRALTTVNIPLFITEVNKLQKLEAGSAEFNKLKESIEKTSSELEKVTPAFKALLIELEQTGSISEKSAQQYRKLDVELREYGLALEALSQVQKDFKAQLSSITGSIAVSPYDKLSQSVTTLLDTSKDAMKGLKAESAVRRTSNADTLASLKEQKKAADEELIAAGKRNNARKRAAQSAVKELEKNIATEEQRGQTQAAQDKDTIARLAAQTTEALNFQKALEKRIGTIRKNEEEILKNNKALATVNKTDRSFANQRVIAQQTTISLSNKVLDLRNQELAAEAALEAAKKNSGKEGSLAVGEANRALEAATERRRIGELQLNQQQLIVDEQIAGIDLAEKLNNIERQRLNVLNEITTTEQKIQLIKAGLGQSAGKGSIANAREARAAQELLLQQNINNLKVKEKQINQEIQKERDKEGGADQKKLTSLLAQKDSVLKTLLNTRQQLDISQRLEEIERNKLLGTTQNLRVQSQMFSMSGIQQKINDEILRQKNAGVAMDSTQIALIEEQIKQQESLNVLINMQESLRDGLTQGLTNGLDGLIQGTMTVKQAFANMGLSVLRIISRIISEMLVARLLMAAFGGATTAVPSAAPLAQNMGQGAIESTLSAGGSLQLRSGGIAKGYSEGGIARGRNAGYPAILHGTEAVVPLPNGNAIPVEMIGGGTSNNTIGININIDNQGNASSTQNQASQQNQAAALGKVVASVVQEELHKQKRPGGILSRYGAA